MGYCLWGHKESDVTERLTLSLHFTGGGGVERLVTSFFLAGGPLLPLCLRLRPSECHLCLHLISTRKNYRMISSGCQIQNS